MGRDWDYEVLTEIFGSGAHRLDLVREDLLVDWKGRLVNPMLAASASRSPPAAWRVSTAT